MRACARREARTRSSGGSRGWFTTSTTSASRTRKPVIPRMALDELRRRGYPEELVDAVAGHAEYLNVPRTTPLAKTLFAVDELSGFISACALVRPTGIEGLKSKSVRKKLKQPSFAAKVDREQIRAGIEELGVDESEHIQFVIDAMAERASELGLAAPPGSPE